VNYLLLLLAFAFHTTAMVYRGFSFNHCPVNNLYEAKALLELVKGVEFNDLNTFSSIANASAMHEKLILYGIRYRPEYKQTVETEFKEIAGYRCQKAIGKMTDGTEINVYFTKELIAANRDFEYAYKSLPGLAMQYETAIGSLKVTYTVSKINFNIVPASKFELPKSGFRVMTYEESVGVGGKN